MSIGVLFDWDGVLLDSMPDHVQAWQKVMSRYGIEVDPLEIYLQEGATSMEIAAELVRRHNMAASPELVQQLVNRKRDAYLVDNHAAMFEGVTEVLDYLQENRYRLAIVTSSVRSQIAPLLHPELLAYFQSVVTADDVDYGKPDPQPYIRAAQRLNCAPRDLLVVENAPLGIMSARAAGMKVVALTSTLGRHHLRMADAIVADFVELRRMLPGLLSGLAFIPLPQPKEKREPDRFLPLVDEDLEER